MLLLTVWICCAIGLTSANYGSPPSVTVEDITVEQGQPVFASCYSTGDSITDIHWAKPDGQRVNYDQQSNVFSSQKNGQLLLIILYPDQTDEGEYVCQEISDGGEVTVLKKFSFRILAESEPTFEEPYVIVEPFEGENVKLTCEALGDQPVEYTWLDPYSSVITNSSSGAEVIHRKNGSELHLLQVSNATSGVYTCTATNHLGTASKLFELTVRHKEDVARPPVFDEARVTVYGFEDELLTLNCHAEGNPRPTYTWYNLYGEKLDRFHQRVIDLEIWNHSLEIPHKRPSTILVSPTNGTLIFVQLKREDDGHYTCYAQNSAGRAAKTYRIYVNETEVGGHLTVRTQNVTHNSVTFEIIAKDVSRVKGIEGRYRLTNETDFVTIRWSVEEEYEVTGLLSGAKYYFQFRILSSDEWTDPIIVALPPGRPEIIVRQMAPNKLNMEFVLPFYLFFYNSVHHYIIKYRTVERVRGNTWKYRDCEVTIELPACYGSSYEISNLANRVYYSITVQAVGPGGYSELSEMKTYLS